MLQHLLVLTTLLLSFSASAKTQPLGYCYQAQNCEVSASETPMTLAQCKHGLNQMRPSTHYYGSWTSTTANGSCTVPYIDTTEEAVAFLRKYSASHPAHYDSIESCDAASQAKGCWTDYFITRGYFCACPYPPR